MRKLFYIITMLVTCLFFLNSNPLYAKSGCEAPKQGPPGPSGGPPGPQGPPGPLGPLGPTGPSGGISSVVSACFIAPDLKTKQPVCHVNELNPPPGVWRQVQFKDEVVNEGTAFEFIIDLDDFIFALRISENGVYDFSYFVNVDNSGGLLAVYDDTLDAPYRCSIMDDGSGNNPLTGFGLFKIDDIDGINTQFHDLRLVSLTTVGQGNFKTINLDANNTISVLGAFTMKKLIPLPFAGP